MARHGLACTRVHDELLLFDDLGRAVQMGEKDPIETWFLAVQWRSRITVTDPPERCSNEDGPRDPARESSSFEDAPLTLAVDTPGALTDALEESGAFSVGEHIGRHVVLEEIGRGGMGKVLRAYDPKLQREVALKKLRPKALGVAGIRRFEQEARAMAKLSHPNVVGVYDVEPLDDGQIVLVMEYVDGPTLRAWLMGSTRDWRAVVALFVGAGRGLAAAHEAGLLHRDFKPANVLVSDTTAKVTDFGLAKRSAEASERHSEGSAEDIFGDETVADDDLTRDGEVLGTPRYMAPEQHRGHPLSTAVDQFAFCVALWEALAQSPPYAGPKIVRKKLAGPPPWPSDRAPRHIGEALRRGLAPKPQDRWPSMTALLDALSFDPLARRTRWLRTAGVVATVGALGAAAYVSKPSGEDPCSGAERKLEASWGLQARAAVHTSMTGIDVAYADAAWQRAESYLDDYADRWVEVRTDACEAAVRKEQSTALMDLQVGCLDRIRLELDAVSRVLQHSDVETLQHSERLLQALPDVERCNDLAALQAGEEPPAPDEATSVRSVRASLATARAERNAGRYATAQRELDAAQSMLTQLAYQPVRAEYERENGFVQDKRGRYAESEQAFRRAIRVAARTRHWDVLRDASAALIWILGGRLGRVDEAFALRELAEGAADGNPLAQAQVHNNLAAGYSERGDYEATEREYRQALDLRQQALGGSHFLVAAARNNLGTALRELGRYPEAEREYREVAAYMIESLGAEHPNVAVVRGNLASLLRQRGRLAEAEAEIRAALDVRRRSLGERHPLVGHSNTTLAEILTDQRRFAEAEQAARTSYEIVRQALGPRHERTANALNTLGRLHLRQGNHQAAEREFRDTLEIRRSNRGDAHPSLGGAHLNIAVVLRTQGKLDQAEAQYREAQRVWEQALGPEHPDLGTLHNNLGNLFLDMHRYRDAESEERRAIEIRQQSLSDDDPSLVESRSNLAAALEGQERFDESEIQRRDVLRALEAQLESDDPSLAMARARLARVLLRRGADDEALLLARAAHQDVRVGALQAGERGTVAFVLARAREATARELQHHAQARTQAEEALQRFIEAGDRHDDQAQSVREWLRAHPE